MKRITATDAARGFADLLDQVEATGEPVVILRRGKAVATIGPAPAANGSALLSAMAEAPRDGSWSDELLELRRWVGPAGDRWVG